MFDLVSSDLLLVQYLLYLDCMFNVSVMHYDY